MNENQLKELKVGKLVWIYNLGGALIPMFVASVSERDVSLTYANHNHDLYFKQNGVTLKPESIYLSN